MSPAPADSQTVHLASSDGKTMEIEAFYLMASSKVFRDMFLDTSLTTVSSEHITLDAPSAILEILFRWLRHESDAGLTITAGDVKSLYALWQRFEFGVIRYRLVDLMHHDPTLLEPLDQFVIASHFDSTMLASAAIRRGSLDQFGLKGTMSAIDNARVAPPYLLGLVNATLKAWSTSTRAPHMYGVPMADIANYFEVASKSKSKCI